MCTPEEVYNSLQDDMSWNDTQREIKMGQWLKNNGWVEVANDSSLPPGYKMVTIEV